ncbi:cupin domain-containing protein [Thermus oshimai]
MQALWFFNTLVHLWVSEVEGQDGLSVLEHRAPFGDSPPLHVHHTEDEVFVVLSRFSLKSPHGCSPPYPPDA